MVLLRQGLPLVELEELTDRATSRWCSRSANIERPAFRSILRGVSR